MSISNPTFSITKPNSSDYMIDGEADPTLTLIRGNTYTFDFQDDGHPFFIKSSLGSGTAGRYDTGVVNQGSSSAESDLTFTVADNAPDTLFYQCSAHYGMNGQIDIFSMRTDDVAEQAYRIYKAAFDRTPDEEGLGYWIQELDKGFALHEVTNSFVISQEFKNLYGADLDNEGFITALYNNVLDRDPDQGGLDYWINDMENNGMSRADVLASFSESAENIANTDPLIELGVVYQPYGDDLIG